MVYIGSLANDRDFIHGIIFSTVVATITRKEKVYMGITGTYIGGKHHRTREMKMRMKRNPLGQQQMMMGPLG